MAGLDTVEGSVVAVYRLVPGWEVDTLVALTDLGRVEVDVERRRVLGVAASAVAALVLPAESWWQRMAQLGRVRSVSGPGQVGVGDVAVVREMVGLFSRMDQRHGGVTSGRPWRGT